MRDNMIFYRSFAEAARNVPDEDRLAFYDALFDYAFNGEEPEDVTGVAMALFTIAKANIDANNRKADLGKKGGRPKEKPMVIEDDENKKPMVLENDGNEKPMVIEDDENKKPMVLENCKNQKAQNTEYRVQNTDNRIQSTEKEQKKKNSRFSKPSLEEVKAFIAEKKLSVSADRFYDYYESNGWKVGKNPMKDWKATVRNWARNDTVKKPTGHITIDPPDYIKDQMNGKYDEEELPDLW